MNAIVDQARANVRKNYKVKHKNLPVFVYNDEFDEEHYTVKDFMIDRLMEVHTFLNLPDGGQWVYFATSHGVIFKYMTAELHPRRLTQLDVEEMKFFIELPNLRYITMNGDSFEIALTHSEDEVPM